MSISNAGRIMFIAGWDNMQPQAAEALLLVAKDVEREEALLGATSRALDALEDAVEHAPSLEELRQMVANAKASARAKR